MTEPVFVEASLALYILTPTVGAVLSINTSTVNVVVFPALSVATNLAYLAPSPLSLNVFVSVITPLCRFAL